MVLGNGLDYDGLLYVMLFVSLENFSPFLLVSSVSSLKLAIVPSYLPSSDKAKGITISCISVYIRTQ
jgi:hypothetical protein